MTTNYSKKFSGNYMKDKKRQNKFENKKNSDRVYLLKTRNFYRIQGLYTQKT